MGERQKPTSITATNQSGYVEYYPDIDPALSSLLNFGILDSTATVEFASARLDKMLPKRRLRVVEYSYRRKSTRWRATIVLHVGGAKLSEDRARGAQRRTNKKKSEVLEDRKQLPGRTYLLKMIWEYPRHESEREALKGTFGLTKHVPYTDAAGGAESANDTHSRQNNWSPQIANTCYEGSVDQRATINHDCTRTRRSCSQILMPNGDETLWASASVEELLEAIIDAVLGYWRLVNLGILHQDISDGNIMVLCGRQKHARRKSNEECTTEALKSRFGVMAESEAKRRGYMDRLDSPTSGIVSEFDLHTRHRCAPAPIGVSNGKAACGNKRDICPPTTGSEPLSKRRKTGTDRSVSITTDRNVKGQGKPWQFGRRNSHCTPEIEDGCWDFRTGTPTFMSIRSLAMKPGARDEYNFMDGLESFFWLILWSIAVHLDPDQHLTSTAQTTIGLLEQVDLDRLAVYKKGLLFECTEDGEEMKERILGFENDWATNDRVSSLIISMGKFLSEFRLKRYDPHTVFPQVVDMIWEARYGKSMS